MNGNSAQTGLGNQQVEEPRSTGRKIFLNFGFLTAGKFLGDGLLFLFFVTLSRLFGKEKLGTYSFSIALTGFIAVISDYGLFNFSVKEVSRRSGQERREITGNILCLRGLLSVAALLILVVSSLFLPLNFEEKVIINLIGIYQILFMMAEGICALFVASEEMHLSGALEILSKALIAISGLVVAFASRDFMTTMATLPVATILVIFICWLVLRWKHGRLIWRRPWSLLLETGRKAVPYALSKILAQVYLRTDVVMIGFMLGSAAAGVYNAAYRLVFFLLFIPQFASMALFPVASKLYERSVSEMRELYKRSLNLNLIIGLPAASGLCLIAPQLIGMIFGAEFSQSVMILRLLSWLLFLMCLKSVLSIFLLSCDREADRTRCQWTAAWVNFVGNLLLIPWLGIQGAAITTLVSDGLLVFLLAYRLEKILGWPQIAKRIAIGGLGAASFYIPFSLSTDLSIFLVLPASVAIYVVVVLLFKQIREDELRMFLNLFRKSAGKHSTT